MSKDKGKAKEKGHEREAYGYKLTTSRAENGWAVQIVAKPRTRDKAKPGDARPIHGTERDGFKFEGEALDWAEDWALENRPYFIDRDTDDRGFTTRVLDDSGQVLWSSGVCPDAADADSLAGLFIAARRRHDVEALEHRRANRANYRLALDDLQAADDDAQRAMDRAKSTLKECETERNRLRVELRSPQIEFSFTAAMDRERARVVRDTAARQTDVEDYAADKDPAAKGRAAIKRSKEQAEATRS